MNNALPSDLSVRAPTILLVEDDAAIRQFLTTSLCAVGYRLHTVSTLLEGKTCLQAQRMDLVILDLGLPDGDGATLIEWLRTSSDIPILVLSARQSEAEKVACIDAGADDYLVKPFGVEELLARVRAALRRSARMQMRDDHYQVEDLHIDTRKAQVLLRGQVLHLTPIEFKLLMLLTQAPGRVFTHRQLLTAVWGAEYVDDTHYLRIHMGRLRQKIEKNSAMPRYVLTEPGIGYRLAAV